MQFDTSGGLFKICEWLYRLAYLNILAICFSLFGGILFGVFPAITAMFVLNNKWLKTKEDFSVSKEFWKAYKMYFLKSNLLGGVILLTMIALYVDFSLIQNFNGVLYYLILSSSATVLVLSVIVILHVFSLMTRYPKKSIFKLIRRAIQISTLFPFLTLWMALSMSSFLFICLIIPGFAFLFLGSGISFLGMYFNHFIFKRIEEKNTIHSSVSIISERGAIHGK
ncbi:YesL family protein [Saliterribacillus persicus]|uniref:Putative membrane protein YesL n=1 Tax=Saliterribacillus persicus TaxID=930114 RepID=A0A368Y651_9BACI|nr:DUF624 domain-containing protein [Saliterribacillus persicus]RCW74818.1 putative membrane protein YesL [Saliterribacillus persicus]